MRNIVLFMLMASLYSCNNNDDEVYIEEVSRDIIIDVYYERESGNDKIPDAGSSVYVYFGIDNGAFLGSTYSGNGVFEKRGEVYQPDQHATVDGNGHVVIQSMYLDSLLAITIMSNYYEGRIATATYSGRDYPIQLQVVNH